MDPDIPIYKISKTSWAATLSLGTPFDLSPGFLILGAVTKKQMVEVFGKQWDQESRPNCGPLKINYLAS